MRLPAVALAVSFGCGVVLGRVSWIAERVASHGFLFVGFASVGVLVCAGLILARLGRLFPAVVLSSFTWVLLGVLGAGIANQPRPADYVLSLVDAGRLNLQTPLRWHGHLRDEPAHLPWGYGYETNLTGVEYAGSLIPVRGGLRLSFWANPSQVVAPDVHAGDEVVAVTEASRPPVFRDDGAFDRRAYLAQQNVDLVGTLRTAKLLERVSAAHTTPAIVLAHVRHRLRDEIDQLFAQKPQAGGVLRAMLLGDRSFVERAESDDFQKTGVFHVLVVAGLHVGALAMVLFWIGRVMKLSPFWTALTTLTVLLAYVAVVEQRPPVIRAALMTAAVVIGGMFFRRLDLLNSAGLAALILLIAKPLAVRDSSFQLTFLAIGCIAGVAVPWLEKRVQPYVKALRGWRDVTRDSTHEPRAAQFRIDLRAVVRWIASHVPAHLGNATGEVMARGLGVSLRVWELLVITLALQIGMLPLMARDFHRVTLSAPLVNLAAVPVTGIIVPLGFVTLACGLILPPLGKLLAVPLTWVTMVLVHVVQWFAHLSAWSYRVPGPPEWLTLVFLVAGVTLAATSRFSKSWRVWPARGATVILGLSTLAIAIFPFSPRWSTGRLELSVLDVGQGDSLLVVSPRGKTLLIDAGGSFGGFSGREEHNGIDPGEEAVSPYLWSRGFQKLDVVALTHAHQDHIGGLAAILRNFRVGTLWIGRKVDSAALANLEKLARERNITIVHELRGNVLSWDGVEAQFLWPEISAGEVATAAKNNDSLVLRLKYGERTFLLPGDAEKQAESAMLDENSETLLHADVLKVGHHGSKNSTTPGFLSAVHPRVAVISAGEHNPYGHPSPELLERLETAGVRILRTDHDGAVHILTDGEQLDISCFVECPNVLGDNPRSPAQSATSGAVTPAAAKNQ